MPIYEFKCKKCGTEFEFLFMPADLAAECPKCYTLHNKDERIEMSVGHFTIDMRNVSPL